MDPVAGGLSLGARFSAVLGDGEAVDLAAGCDWASADIGPLIIKTSGNTIKNAAARCRQKLCVEAPGGEESVFIVVPLSSRRSLRPALSVPVRSPR